MKVVLIIPERPYLFNQKALPNLGVLYVAHALKKLGHEVKILDFADGWKFIKADIYGISIVTPDFIKAKEILKWLKDKGAKRVVAGGVHANLCPNECLEAGFDAVSVGDGELTAESLLYERKVETLAKNIDDFYPDRKIINLWDYIFFIDGIRATPMMTARGCIWGKCAFCCRYYKTVRFNSVEHVKKEIEEIAKLGFSGIMVYDDEFFAYPERDIEIIKLFRKHKMVWRCFSRSDLILKNKELIRFASENGLRELLIGIESADDKMLETIEKGTTVKMNKEAIKFLHSMGIKVKCAMMIGLPGESKQSLMNTWNFCEEMKNYIYDFDFCIYTPMPGSKIWDNPEKYDLSFNKIYKPYKSEPFECTIKTSKITSKELLEWREKLEKKFK